MDDKILSFIGICRKARQLVLGRSAVKEGLQKNKVKLILMTSDLSVRSVKEVIEASKEANVSCLRLNINMEELSHILGKSFGIIGLLDDGIANKINEMVLMSNKEECGL